MHLDYLCALFDVMYLAVLLKRMWTEPTTLFYFLYICVKTLPHVPLMLGLCQPFLRYFHGSGWVWMGRATVRALQGEFAVLVGSCRGL